MRHNPGESVVTAVSLNSTEDSFDSRSNHSGCNPSGATVDVDAGVEAMFHADSGKILVADKVMSKHSPAVFAKCLLAAPLHPDAAQVESGSGIAVDGEAVILGHPLKKAIRNIDGLRGEPTNLIYEKMVS
ncbi:uncharacterized protein FTOL_06450 [Fusarium torulosum]|uniref:Uncharacterized protein n=1 Tax=Fusarium torulosum TaxID=33205 RepID=A0AAE8MBG4_9HYPO|nr:uncharacterized protein FTOL_06450 [Fusarium torulosum]